MSDRGLQKNSKLNPIDFQKIKNRFFGNLELNSPRAPLPPTEKKPYIDEMSFVENIWDALGEKTPWEDKDIKINYLQKAEITFERLEKEPNPKRFVEIFQVIYNNMYENLETGITPRITGYTESLIGKLLFSLEESFEHFGYSHLLLKKKIADEDSQVVDLKTSLLLKSKEPYTYRIPAKYQLEYIGNVFGVEESNEIIKNGFKTERLESFLNENKNNKKTWWKKMNLGWEIGIKNFLPYFIIRKKDDKK